MPGFGAIATRTVVSDGSRPTNATPGRPFPPTAAIFNHGAGLGLTTELAVTDAATSTDATSDNPNPAAIRRSFDNTFAAYAARMSSGIDHGCSITSRYMSHTCSVPSGAFTKFTARNQVSVEATISCFPSTRDAVKVAPYGFSACR